MTTLLVMIPVPPDEAKQRLARAKQESRAARKYARGLAEFAPKDKRIAAKVTKFLATADLNDRIAAGCTAALEDDTQILVETDSQTAVEELPDPDPVSDEPVTEYAGVNEEGG